ncbi:hypothetical protein ACFQ7F_25205 [Streptomyces sp. NPDC056486]|uniref:hypothetical protein n=1 Tax=Streptomyces sp. NPDC056486 TaxID=3345835 RepID=UPI0036775954
MPDDVENWIKKEKLKYAQGGKEHHDGRHDHGHGLQLHPALPYYGSCGRERH